MWLEFKNGMNKNHYNVYVQLKPIRWRWWWQRNKKKQQQQLRTQTVKWCILCSLEITRPLLTMVLSFLLCWHFGTERFAWWSFFSFLWFDSVSVFVKALWFLHTVCVFWILLSHKYLHFFYVVSGVAYEAVKIFSWWSRWIRFKSKWMNEWIRRTGTTGIRLFKIKTHTRPSFVYSTDFSHSNLF